MTWIYEHPDWPDFHWQTDRLPLAAARERHAHLMERLSHLDPTAMDWIHLRSPEEEVRCTSAIEGVVFHPDSVRASLARRLGIPVGNASSPKDRNLEGITSVILDAVHRCREPVTAKRLQGWQAAMFPSGYSGLHPVLVAAWRLGPVHIVSGRMGRERVHYAAPPAERVPAEMERLLIWYAEETELDPVIKAGLVHFWFEAIHPFEDGNGRTGRALMELTLARGEPVPFRGYSMSAQIAKEDEDYYRHLERQSRGSLDVTEWLTWFVSCYDHALVRAEQELDTTLRLARLWERVEACGISNGGRKVLRRMTMPDWEGPMTTRKYARLIHVTEEDAEQGMEVLRACGLLLPAGRDGHYRLVSGEQEIGAVAPAERGPQGPGLEPY